LCFVSLVSLFTLSLFGLQSRDAINMVISLIIVRMRRFPEIGVV
jgi:hypothetical protein